MGDQTRTRNPFGDDLRRWRGNLYGRAGGLHPFAALAGVLGSNDSDYPDLCRNNIELFTNFFADPGKLCSALTNLFRFIYIFDYFYAWKLRRKRFALRFLAGVFRDDQFFLDILLYERFGFIKQMELLRSFFIYGTLFTLAAEYGLLEHPNLFFKNSYMLIFTKDERLKFIRIIG
jgi:hypothetical protein